MDFPLKGLFKDVFRTTAPIVITLMALLYIGGLAVYQKYIRQPTPSFNFYSNSIVKVHILPDNQAYAVSGIFNNVIEGQRKIVQSGTDSAGVYTLPFQVNSPRQATVYVEGEAIEIFVALDSMLTVEVMLNPQEGTIDSIYFKGATAPICKYYWLKNKAFDNTKLKNIKHTTASEDLMAYGKFLDSLTQKEDDFLLAMQKQLNLPTWFTDFEKNELMYEKAYLKLAHLGNQAILAGYLDTVPVDTKDAVFSYYYYLYLNSLLSQQIKNGSSTVDTSAKSLILKQLTIADTLLKTETHDVFLTRIIFAQIQRKNYDFARELFDKFGNFKEQRYYRFLKMQLKQKEVAKE